MHHQNKFWAQLPVLGTKETQVWFLIFSISSLCFSSKSISSVVLLVIKHQMFVKRTSKQVLGPIARFRPKRNASIVFDLFKLLFVIIDKSISSVILLVNKHQNFVKWTTKTSFGPNCPF